MRDVGGSVDQMQQVIISSYYHNPLNKTTRPPRNAPWWNKMLCGSQNWKLRVFNLAKRTGQWNTIRRPWPAITKKSGRPNVPYGGSTATISMMYQTVSDSSGLAPSSYLAVSTRRLEGRLWKSCSGLTFPIPNCNPAIIWTANRVLAVEKKIINFMQKHVT
jgi:hypothetical protein